MNKTNTKIIPESNYSLSSQQTLDITTLIPALTVFCTNLQTQLNNANISSNEVPEDLIERLGNVMKKEKFLQSAIAAYGEPVQISDGRFGWRPFGYKDKYIKKKTKELVYEEAWNIFKNREEQNNLTLEDAIEKYISYKTDVKGSTHQKYRDNINLFLGEYLNKPLHKLTALEIEKSYKNTLVNKTPHTTTIKGFRGTLERVLKHVKKHYSQQLQFDIADLMDDLRENTNKKLLQGKKQILLFQETKDRYTLNEAILFVTEAIKRNTLQSLAAALLFFTGCRASEICGSYVLDYNLVDCTLDIKHAALVNKKTNEYYIGSPKGDKERIVVYPDKANIILNKIMNLNNNSPTYMFPIEHKRIEAEWMTTRQLDKEIADICKSIGISRKSAHDIRRTYDSILDEVSMPSALRHLLMGHELAGIEAHYLRDAHNLDEIKEIINQAFKKFEIKITE